jgi:hypothetical protein
MFNSGILADEDVVGEDVCLEGATPKYVKCQE